MPKEVAAIVFFFAWLLCGCSVEKICDDWRACVIFVIAMIVIVACAAAMGKEK